MKNLINSRLTVFSRTVSVLNSHHQARSYEGRVLGLGCALMLGFNFAAHAQSQYAVDLLDLQTKLTNSDSKAFNFGVSTAIEGDTLAVADNGYGVSAGEFGGAVFLFVRSGTNWMPQAVLKPSDGAPGAEWGTAFGAQVAINGDTAIVGAPHDEDLGLYSGSAYIFVRSGTNWTRQAKLTASDGAAQRFFGGQVAISSNTVVIGSIQAYTNVYVFVRSETGTNWTQQATLTNNVAGDGFGASVAINGNTIVVGSGAGAAYVFTRSGTNWTRQARLTASDGGLADGFGSPVAISGDANMVVVGALGADSATGAAYIFKRSGNAWTEQAKVTASDASGYDYFGVSLGVSGDTIVIAADPVWQTQEKVAYVFTQQGTNWIERTKLTAAGPVGSGGSAQIALSADTIVLGVGGYNSVFVFAPDYRDEKNVATYVKRFLYWPDAAASSAFDKDQAAFRYKHLLYGTESNQVRAASDTMASLYGAAVRGRSLTAEEELKKGLALNPTSPALRSLLLDIYYDRTAAEAILANEMLAGLEQQRLGPPSVAGGFVIDDEIGICASALAANRAALQTYLVLLTNELGVAGSPPLGMQLFQQLVPARGLDPASCIASNGTIHSVTGNSAPLFSGYRDLVLLYGVLRDYGHNAVTLARLYYGRNNAGDLDRARSLVTDSQRFLYLHGAVLLGSFPGLDPANTNTVEAASGLAESIASVNGSLEELNKFRTTLEGGGNPVDFESDFLMLVQKFVGPSGTAFDSFDAFQLDLDPTGLSSPLRYAKDLLTQARTSYDSYRGYQDQLQTQLSDTTSSAQDRLYQIVGAFPGDAAYATPELNDGSEIWQQYSSIKLAQLAVQKNSVQMDNLRAQVQIEMERAAAVTNAQVRFGDKQAELTKEIARIAAAQAACQGMADSLSIEKLTTGAFIGTLLNAAAQGYGEVAKGNLEAQKEKNAATQEATIEGLNSAAQVKTMLLEMNTLLVDSQEAALQLQQAVGQLCGLYRQKADLEGTIAESSEELASRYFADPVHHLRCLNNTLLANLSFEEAQKWLYFMARALEYKWNTPFANYSYLGKLWSTASLYKLRNGEELDRFYNALASFNSLVQLPQDDYYDGFSVREHFLGYKQYDATGTNLMLYPDPGNPYGPANLTAIQAFRQKLRGLTDSLGNIVLNFNTRREIPGSTFYRGPRFDSRLQNVLSAGLFLDKIKWIKISLPGNHTLGRSQLAGDLTYGGSSFIRNFDVGTFVPGRPDRLRNEETVYSTRYWYFHAPSAKWRFSEALKSPVTMVLTNNAEMPPTVAEIDVFKERSVAATGWVLSIPTQDLGVPVLKIDELDDVKIWFYHYAVSRQMPEGAVAGATMVEGKSAAPRSIPFPYYLKYHTNPEEGGK